MEPYIRQGILLEPIVGADETGAKVNGKRSWFHTYQTSDHTFIGFHPSRGIKGRKHFYPDGLPYAILISDCLAMQLSTPAAAHQLCLVYLLRELNALVEIHPGRMWPAQIKRQHLTRCICSNVYAIAGFAFGKRRYTILETAKRRLGRARPSEGGRTFKSSVRILVSVSGKN